MPYLSQKIRIQGTKYDRRSKLTPDQKLEIKRKSAGGYSQRQLAREYNVSRRLIQFIICPEKLAINRMNHDSSKYYNKDKQREYIKNHRRYKQSLKIAGKIY